MYRSVLDKSTVEKLYHPRMMAWQSCNMLLYAHAIQQQKSPSLDFSLACIFGYNLDGFTDDRR